MTETYRAQLVHTLRSVLRPLARILFRAGVRFDEFVELLRGIYVEITIRDALDAGQRISTGRISILSGVSKRDVDRLISTDDWLRIPKPTDAAALAAVLHRWHTDSAFLGPYGVPLELPLTGQGGRNFTDLVAGSPIAIDATNAPAIGKAGGQRVVNHNSSGSTTAPGLNESQDSVGWVTT